MVEKSHRRQARVWVVAMLLAGVCRVPPASQGPRTLRGHTDDIYALAFSSGGVLASASGDGTVKLWDLAAGREKATLEGHDGLVYGTAFTRDGKTVASGGGDGTVRLWDVASSRQRQLFKGHEQAVYAVAFSPDGSLHASAGDDQTVRLWDVREGRSLAILRGHTGKIYGLAFSADGKLLASSGGDRMIRLWDVAGRRLARVPSGPPQQRLPIGHFSGR